MLVKLFQSSIGTTAGILVSRPARAFISLTTQLPLYLQCAAILMAQKQCRKSIVRDPAIRKSQQTNGPNFSSYFGFPSAMPRT